MAMELVPVGLAAGSVDLARKCLCEAAAQSGAGAGAGAGFGAGAGAGLGAGAGAGAGLGAGGGVHGPGLRLHHTASAGCGINAPPATTIVAANITAALCGERSPALVLFFRPLAISDATTQRLMVAFHTIR